MTLSLHFPKFFVSTLEKYRNSARTRHSIKYICSHPVGSVRKLKDETALLLVRVRGWHLDEAHILCDGIPMVGGLVDFGLYFFHNTSVRLANNTAPYFYLPKMETHLECRLWNNVFRFAEDHCKIQRGEDR